jgi:hypothetical protein
MIISRGSNYGLYTEATAYDCEITLFDGVGDTRSDVNAYDTNQTPFLVEVIHDHDTAPVLYTNGTALALSMSNANPGTDGLSGSATYIGGYGTTNGLYTFNGVLGELIVYSGALSEANRKSIETYLNTKWSLWE